jgi:hypothetical protein
LKCENGEFCNKLGIIVYWKWFRFYCISSRLLVTVFEKILYTSKKFMMGTISSRILHQLRYIYPVRRCRWNVVSNTYWLYIRVIWQGLITLRGHLCLLRFVLLILFMCVSVLSSVLWCLLRFQQQQQQMLLFFNDSVHIKYDARFYMSPFFFFRKEMYIMRMQ